MSFSNKDNSLVRARSIPLGKRISGLVGQSDKVDYYSFRLSQVSDLSLSFGRLKSSDRVQVKILSSSGGTLTKFNVGNKSQILENTLGAGKYYIRVANKGRNQSVNYQFKTVAPIAEPGETLQTAYNIGNIAGAFTYRDSVDEKDTLDYYQFSLDYLSDFNAGLSGISGAAKISLYRDANNDGLVDSSEQLDYETTSQGSLSRFLTTGTYFIAVEKSSVATQYDLALTTTPYPEYTSAINDDRALSARNITLAQPYSTKDYVGEFDNLDFYKFSLNSVSDFNANISGVPGRARMTLYRDSNNNGLADSNESLTDIFSDRDGNNVSQLLTPGTYLIGVEKYDVTARYDLTLAATPYSGYTPAGDPGDRPLTARDLGNFSGTFTTKDYVGNLDGADYYKFSLNQTQNFNASFSAVPGRISMYLYRDANNNGFIDSGERVDYRYSDQASKAISGKQITRCLRLRSASLHPERSRRVKSLPEIA